MVEKMITLEKISKSYKMGDEIINALKSISLTISKNEYVALMGPSGSGKSTLMNILGCLDSPTSGKYILNDIDVSLMTDSDLWSSEKQTDRFCISDIRLTSETFCSW